MRHATTKALLAAGAVALMTAGCATRLEFGPGYYHYDTRAAAAVEVAPSTVTVTEPVVVYRERTITH